MTEELTVLDDLELVELSIVDRPANPEAQVVIAKRQDKETKVTDKTKDKVEVNEEVEALKADVERLRSETERLTKALLDADYVISEKSIEKKAPVEFIEVEGEKINKAEIPSVILKRLEEAEIEKAEVALTKAATEMLPHVAEDVAKKLYSAHKDDADMVEALKAFDNVYKEATEEVGKSAPKELTAKQAVNEMIEKSLKENPEMTKEQALAQVAKTNPALVVEMRKEGN